jgi:hypothetical protein
MSILAAPSVLPADFSRLGEEARTVEAARSLADQRPPVGQQERSRRFQICNPGFEAITGRLGNEPLTHLLRRGRGTPRLQALIRKMAMIAPDSDIALRRSDLVRCFAWSESARKAQSHSEPSVGTAGVKRYAA